MLSVIGARIFTEDVSNSLPAACAVEFIHTSSLIFDDMPCMDDAELRRGLPVLHKVFGEDVALLAGIALLNSAYGIFGRQPALILEATRCIGVEGMIGGQALDLRAELNVCQTPEERTASLAERNRKTSAMMRLALIAGALACGVAESEIGPLAEAGTTLGEAYQMGDDLLDVRQTALETGKTAGQDVRHARPSHVSGDANETIEELKSMMAATSASLIQAYGAQRVEGLLMFVKGIFTSLLVERG
jgi:geranylgeranyl diphosphate synthase type II